MATFLPVVTQSILSSQFVRVQVFADDQGVEIDPTGYVVQLAFPVQGVAPIGGDWKVGTWETSPDTYYARITVGPSGGFIPIIGRYDIWVKVLAGGETPTEKVGVLVVTI